MQIKSTTLSATVDDVGISSEWLQRHFGFVQAIAAEGFAYLRHPDSGIDIAFMQRGIDVLPPALRQVHARGFIIAFVVSSLEQEQTRLREQGVNITLPLQEDAWGERLLQVTDPNGLTYQLVEWTEDATAPQADRVTST